MKYADYDGTGTVFACSRFPAGACGPLLPGQGVLSAGGPQALLIGQQVSLVGTADSRARISSWRWQQLEGPPVTLVAADSQILRFTAPAQETSLVFGLTAVAEDGYEYREVFRFPVFERAVDEDRNGLIDIDSLTMLHNMRHDLAGTSYRSGADSVRNTIGCPDMGCTGYELTGNLDFDADGDGSSWTGNSNQGYLLDTGDSRALWFVVDSDGAGGWQPIGDKSHPFTAVFDGNGYSIRNLGIRSDQTQIGLFGTLGSGAAVRNLGLIANLAEHVGFKAETNVGGLAGQQSGGSITASYATGPVQGGAGRLDTAGGLVGWQSGGSITASYATGAVRGGSGDEDRVGGLVGRQGGSVTAGYATGDAAGGSGDGDSVGGLVGVQDPGGSITASYATGAADGGGEPLDSVGALVGSSQGGSVTASYGFGEILGGGRLGSAGSAARPRKSSLLTLSADLAPPEWNAAANNTQGAWDFGTDSQIPVLRYADYDGAGSAFDCARLPAGACGTLLPRQAGLGADGPAYLTAASDLTAASASSVTLSVNAAGRVPRDSFVSWGWRQVGGDSVTLTAADTPEALFIVPNSGGPLVFEVTVVDDNGDEYTDFVTLLLLPAVDRDRNGLIEIDDLTMLHNMRNNLAGTAYESETIGVANSAGCPSRGLQRL